MRPASSAELGIVALDDRLDLVGHSAGAIAICNLVSRTMARKEVFSFNHIILLAPACTTELFQTTLLANPSRYRSLRIFTMTDENECRDMLVPYLYTRSLLYLISGILEDEGRAFDASLLGLQRHIAFRHPYDTDTLKPLHDYLYENGSDRLCFSQTVEGAPVGLQTRSLKHGDFDDDPDTLASITAILKTK